MSEGAATRAFRAARDILLAHRTDLAAARAAFVWPPLDAFNWAFDWFDVIARDNDRVALRVVSAADTAEATFAQLSCASGALAGWLDAIGVRRGDYVMAVLPNGIPLYELILAVMKTGAVLVPTYTSVAPTELADRIARANVRWVVTTDALAPRFARARGGWRGIAVGGAPPPGWLDYGDAARAAAGPPRARPTRATDPLFAYFTSGTTALPKLVLHSHASYPVGHLSGMYWNGIVPGDVHCNVAAPGWAKHAWSSFFVPWNAEATIVVLDVHPPSARCVLDVLAAQRVTSVCAPPTIWRELVREPLAAWRVRVREAVSAGEPLDADVVRRVRDAWGVSVRDGYGQTETTCQIGNPPGAPLVPGSMGRPMPGYDIVLLDAADIPTAAEGEIAVDLRRRPAGMMTGYAHDPAATARAFEGGYYRTGDIARRDADGYFTYVGRNDDVFKSFDCRISPFELEDALLHDPAVAEAAVIASPDPLGTYVPKAYVVAAAGCARNADDAAAIVARANDALPPEKWIKRIAFVDALPRTVSGKIRRAELRARELSSAAGTQTGS